jgi:hypothetical protein
MTPKLLAASPLAVLFAASLVPAILISAPQESTLLRNTTTVVVGATEDAIVVGQDQTQFATYPSQFIFCAPETICAVQGVVALPSDAKCPQGGLIDFDATHWMPRIDQDETAEGDAPRVIAYRIWKKLRGTFDPALVCFYFHTETGRALLAENTDSPLSIVVAGFSRGSNAPEIYTIRVQFDRQNERLLYPAPEVSLPRDQQFQFRFGTLGNPPFALVMGDQDSLKAVQANEDPFAPVFRGFYPQRLEAARLTLKDSSLSVQATVAWVASLIDVEREFDERLGGEDSIAVVRKGQPHRVLTMNRISSW